MGTSEEEEMKRRFAALRNIGGKRDDFWDEDIHEEDNWFNNLVRRGDAPGPEDIYKPPPYKPHKSTGNERNRYYSGYIKQKDARKPQTLKQQKETLKNMGLRPVGELKKEYKKMLTTPTTTPTPKEYKMILKKAKAKKTPRPKPKTKKKKDGFNLFDYIGS